MQAAKLLVHVNEAGRDARKAAIALISCIGHINSVSYCLEKALKTAFGNALFAKLVKPLFGFDDLVLRLGRNFDLGGLRSDVAAKLDQLAPDRQIIDHLRIVFRGIGRNRCPREAHKIGRATQFLQARVVFEKGLQRHRRGKRVLLDARGRNFEDALVHGIKEMLGLHLGRNAVIDIIVGQNRAQKLLFSLDIVRQDFGLGGWLRRNQGT